MKPDHFSHDVLEFLSALSEYGVEYLLVGGEAVIYYGYPRFTGDIDIFYNGSEDNAGRLWDALNSFWHNDIPGMHGKDELLEKEVVFHFGVPPNRIDLLSSLDGVSFQSAWEKRIEEELILPDRAIKICFIGIDALIENKKAVARHRDLEDLRYLERMKNLLGKKKP